MNSLIKIKDLNRYIRCLFLQFIAFRNLSWSVEVYMQYYISLYLSAKLQVDKNKKSKKWQRKKNNMY